MSKMGRSSILFVSLSHSCKFTQAIVFLGQARSCEDYRHYHVPSKLRSPFPEKVDFKRNKGSIISPVQRTILTTPYSHQNIPSRGSTMSYFVIGVSGITCGGKTTLTQLLKRTFPWCRIIYQDSYFHDDDYPGHVRVPEVRNHVNYEILGSMDMPKMYKDVQGILDSPPEFFDGRPDGLRSQKSQKVDGEAHTEQDIPNFDAATLELLETVKHLDFDVSKYKNIPILIVEGFIIFESDFLYDKCDVRFYVNLDEEECLRRRSSRTYNPPDGPGYFDKIVWPESLKHYTKFISGRGGIRVFDGKDSIANIWKDSIEIVTCRLKEKYFVSQDEKYV